MSRTSPKCRKEAAAPGKDKEERSLGDELMMGGKQFILGLCRPRFVCASPRRPKGPKVDFLSSHHISAALVASSVIHFCRS